MSIYLGYWKIDVRTFCCGCWRQEPGIWELAKLLRSTFSAWRGSFPRSFSFRLVFFLKPIRIITRDLDASFNDVLGKIMCSIKSSEPSAPSYRPRCRQGILDDFQILCLFIFIYLLLQLHPVFKELKAMHIIHPYTNLLRSVCLKDLESPMLI